MEEGMAGGEGFFRGFNFLKMHVLGRREEWAVGRGEEEKWGRKREGGREGGARMELNRIEFFPKWNWMMRMDSFFRSFLSCESHGGRLLPDLTRACCRD